MINGHAEPPFLPPNEQVDFSNCDLEPIHIPSAIQPHGVLLAARASDLRVAYVSENSSSMLGLEPAQILNRTLPELLGAETAQSIEACLEQEHAYPASLLTCRLAFKDSALFDILAHRSGDMVCVEMEPATGERAWDVLALRMQESIQKLSRHSTQEELWTAAARLFRENTGYDRVMVYRFDREGHGEVIAEERDPAMEPYLGLHYPATDIPQQARRLYLLQRLRMIADVNYTPARLLAYPQLAGDAPLDMTYCGLRSISPMHIEYLQNMGVGATLAVSLVHRNTLWGMIVCHHRTQKHAPPEVRALCDLLGQMLSLLIEATNQNEEHRKRLQQQALLARIGEAMAQDESVLDALADEAKSLLALTAAEGVYIRLGGQSRLLGTTPPLAETTAIIEACRDRLVRGSVAFEDLGQQLPQFQSLARVASGVLLLQIPGSPGNSILWFRPEVATTVRWGGNPREAHVESSPRLALYGSGASGAPLGGPAPAVRVSPRRSFALWEELQRGRSRLWGDMDLEAAEGLQRLITGALLHKTEARLSQLSYSDPLTSLPNRRVLTERLDAWRTSGSQQEAALLFLDLDNFKLVNDSLGHDVGDELLRQIGRRLALCAGHRNLVARLGGDEFVVFCEDTPIAVAQELATAIVQSFTDPFVIEGRPFRTTVSIGIAPVLSLDTVADAGSLEKISELDRTEPLRAADLAMYVAKKKGGNQVTIAETPQHETVLRQLHLEQGVFQALDRNELSLAFQAQLAPATGTLTGFEALLRWDHSLYGRIPPGDFIPVAERTGQIIQIGAWVLEQALRQVGEWRARVHPALTISVNVSAEQVCRADFRQIIQRAIDRARVPASALHLEVTESIFLQDTAVLHLEEVRSLGVLISVDDFGTGYSSLAYLQRLPIDEVKIDKSLLDTITESPRSMALFESIIHMAHAMEMTVVAEGVETYDQWERLKSVGCDSAQGFLLSRPISAAEVDQRFATEESMAFFAPPGNSLAPLPPDLPSAYAGLP